VLAHLLGRSVLYRELSFEDHKALMISSGVPEPIAQMNAQAFRQTAEGDAEWLTTDVATVLGHAATSFQQFATDHAESFR
jgi:hypothetical protein